MARARGGDALGEQAIVPTVPGRLFLAASYLTLVVGGVVLAVFGAFLLPYSVSPAVHAISSGGGGAAGSHVLASGGGGGFGQLLSVGLLVVLIGNPLLSMAGYWMAGTRLAAVAPLLGWLPIVLILGSSQSTGTTVLSSDLRSSAFLLLGVLSFLAVAALGRPTRGAGAPPPPPPPTPTKTVTRRTAPKGGRRR